MQHPLSLVHLRCVPDARGHDGAELVDMTSVCMQGTRVTVVRNLWVKSAARSAEFRQALGPAARWLSAAAGSAGDWHPAPAPLPPSQQRPSPVNNRCLQLSYNQVLRQWPHRGPPCCPMLPDVQCMQRAGSAVDSDTGATRQIPSMPVPARCGRSPASGVPRAAHAEAAAAQGAPPQSRPPLTTQPSAACRDRTHALIWWMLLNVAQSPAADACVECQRFRMQRGAWSGDKMPRHPQVGQADAIGCAKQTGTCAAA